MRYMGGCTECHTVWWGCRCPLRCEECGAGYRDDSNSNCGTPGCKTGQRRSWAMQDRWDAELEASRAEIQCEVVEPALAGPETQGDYEPLLPSPPEAEPGCEICTPSDPAPPEAGGGSPSAALLPLEVEGGAITTPPPSRPSARRQPAPKVHTDRRTPQPSKPAHRPVAERRAAVEALLSEGLSNREIARRAQVSPSTVSTIRMAREAAKIGS